MPTKSDIVDGRNLGKWLRGLRAERRAKPWFDEELAALLEQIPGWEWEPRRGAARDETLWESRRQELLAHLAANGGQFPTAADTRPLYDSVRDRASGLGPTRCAGHWLDMFAPGPVATTLPSTAPRTKSDIGATGGTWGSGWCTRFGGPSARAKPWFDEDWLRS